MSGFHYTKGLIGDYSLYYEVLNYRNELEAFCDQYGGKDYGNGGLFISDSVKLNTDLKDEPLPSRSYSFRNTDYEYDFIFTDLKKELQEI